MIKNPVATYFLTGTVFVLIGMFCYTHKIMWGFHAMYFILVVYVFAGIMLYVRHKWKKKSEPIKKQQLFCKRCKRPLSMMGQQKRCKCGQMIK